MKHNSTIVNLWQKEVNTEVKKLKGPVNQDHKRLKQTTHSESKILYVPLSFN